MIIGKSTTKGRMATTEVDFNRNIECDGFALVIPTRVSIIMVGGQYFTRCDEEPFTGIVSIFPTMREYVRWKDKVYYVDSPEQFAVLRNIIETEFAICQLK